MRELLTRCWVAFWRGVRQGFTSHTPLIEHVTFRGLLRGLAILLLITAAFAGGAPVLISYLRTLNPGNLIGVILGAVFAGSLIALVMTWTVFVLLAVSWSLKAAALQFGRTVTIAVDAPRRRARARHEQGTALTPAAPPYGRGTEGSAPIQQHEGQDSPNTGAKTIPDDGGRATHGDRCLVLTPDAVPVNPLPKERTMP